MNLTTTTTTTAATDPTPPPAWIKEQTSIRSQIIEQDDDPPPPLTLIGGVDISFVKDTTRALSAFVVMKYPSMDIVHEEYRLCEMTEPYIAGFLAFREVHHIKALIDALKRTKSHLIPQIIMVDGNGILHPRRCGLASHLGVLVDIPTIGIGKNLLHVDGLDKAQIQVWRTSQHRQPEQKEDGKDGTGGTGGTDGTDGTDGKEKATTTTVRRLNLVGTSGQTWGAALCVKGVSKPIYVSVGHRISLETAIGITVACSEFRIPAPVRAADLGSREMLRQMAEENVESI